MVLEKTLENSLDSKEIRSVNPKGNQPEYSLERLSMKLKLQYFCYLMWRADSLEKTLMLGKLEDGRRRQWQRMRWLESVIDSRDMDLIKLWEIVADRGNCVLQSMGVTKNWTQFSNWITSNKTAGDVSIR